MRQRKPVGSTSRIRATDSIRTCVPPCGRATWMFTIQDTASCSCGCEMELNTLEVRHGLRSSTCESRWQDACICSLARQADACSALQWHRTPLWYNEGRPAPCAAAPALFQCHPVLSETPGMHQPMPVVTLLHTPDGGSYTKAPPAALILLSYTYCLNSLMVTCDPDVV